MMCCTGSTTTKVQLCRWLLQLKFLLLVHLHVNTEHLCCASLLKDAGRHSLCHAEHYADDLEVDLQDLLLQDFNLEAQDDSCREVRLSGSAAAPAEALLSGLSTAEASMLHPVSLTACRCSLTCLMHARGLALHTAGKCRSPLYMASTSSAPQQLCVPQVATVLVSLHQECLQGNFQRIKALQQSTPANNTAASQRQQARPCCIALLALFWQDSF